MYARADREADGSRPPIVVRRRHWIDIDLPRRRRPHQKRTCRPVARGVIQRVRAGRAAPTTPSGSGVTPSDINSKCRSRRPPWRRRGGSILSRRPRVELPEHVSRRGGGAASFAVGGAAWRMARGAGAATGAAAVDAGASDSSSSSDEVSKMSFLRRLGAGTGAGAGAGARFRLASSSLSTVRSMQSAIPFHSAASGLSQP